MLVASAFGEGRGRKQDWASANSWGALELTYLFSIIPGGSERIWSLNKIINQSLEMSLECGMTLERYFSSVKVFT